MGMLAVHVRPAGLEGWEGQLYELPHGRASVLFVLVAGVGVSLLASSRTTTRNGARMRLGWRALVLLPVGLALQELDHRVLVILQDYAVLFLVGIAALGLPNRWLLGLACLIMLLGPLVFFAGEVLDPGTFDRSAVSISDPVGEIAHGLALSGPYPLITWASPFLFGMWLGRKGLRQPRVRFALVAAGAVATLLTALVSGVLESAVATPAGSVGWDQLLVDAPHSQMPLWLLGSTGSAAFMLGASLFVADLFGRVAWPLVATGQLALTVYVGHLLVLHWWSDVLRRDTVTEALAAVLLFMVAASFIAVLWRAFFARGPLESALNLPWGVSAWLRARRANDQ